MQAEGSFVTELLTILNGYSTAIQALATIVLVGITAWYAKVNHDLLKETRQSRRHQLMPILWLRDVPDRTHQLFRVKRLNDSTARDVTVEAIKMVGPQII